ncbi:lipase-like PAD4 [Cryptomeria japonica]|uniref:lipase-like PAD4 n=1 Tax=Cryptomeria japonica TaxID=3369 RepID=UPI0027DA0424|nr:lipase-like PAD4 [Cryptomeria japonica]
MKKKGLTPDKVTFNFVINGFCLERNIRAAQNVLCDILEKGLVPDMVTYSTLIDGYCKGEIETNDFYCWTKSAFDALKKAANLKNQHDMDINDLNSELSENQSRLAELEWYIKTISKGNSCSSYDVFRDLGEKKDFRINRHRMNPEDFWDKIIDMVKNHQLPSDFRYQNKWINAGTAYRRLVEPLDVTYFYHLHSDRGSYLSTKNRPLRHRVLEKWLDDKNQTRIERGKRGKKARTKFASLNEDSRFWVCVQEALKTLQQQVMTESLEKFEDYVWRMITDKSSKMELTLVRYCNHFKNIWLSVVQQWTHLFIYQTLFFHPLTPMVGRSGP